MLAAARCLCGRNAGLVAILGTGSNTCYYNGTEIRNSVASLGYVLGDEGSGAHIGKTFIQAYLNHELPEHLEKRFFERFKLTKDDILDSVYRKPMPNRFLASFSKFVFQNLKEQYVIDMVVKCFAQFFEKHICKYPLHKEMQLNCSGSIAFYFSDVLRKVASEYSVNIGTIVESPIAGLTLFHLEE
jgi:N-acetylglucosamine kinase-like BadF-type ATPase